MHPRSYFSSISSIQVAEIMFSCFISKFNTVIRLLPVLFPVFLQPCLVENITQSRPAHHGAPKLSVHK